MLASLVSLLVALGQLPIASAPPPADPVVIQMDDIGDAWPGGLPAASLRPARGQRALAVGAVTDLRSWIALTRTLETEMVLATPDFATHVALFVIADGLSPLDFHRVTRDGRTLVLDWSPSPNWIAIEGPHLLLVVVPRGAADLVSFRDVSRTRDVDVGTVRLQP